MPGDFAERIDALKEIVGHGHLEASVEFDQVYAFNQHEGLWIDFMGRYGPKTMHGGKPKFLQDPLLSGAEDFPRLLGEHLLHEGPDVGAIEYAEKLAEKASADAPVEFGDLAESAHPKVTSDGAVIYDRPPLVPRLGNDALAAKAGKHDRKRDYLPASHPLHGTTHPTSAPRPEPTIG